MNASLEEGMEFEGIFQRVNAPKESREVRLARAFERVCLVLPMGVPIITSESDALLYGENNFQFKITSRGRLGFFTAESLDSFGRARSFGYVKDGTVRFSKRYYGTNPNAAITSQIPEIIYEGIITRNRNKLVMQGFYQPPETDFRDGGDWVMRQRSGRAL